MAFVRSELLYLFGFCKISKYLLCADLVEYYFEQSVVCHGCYIKYSAFAEFLMHYSFSDGISLASVLGSILC